MDAITIQVNRNAFKAWLKAQPRDKRFNMLSSARCAGHDYIQALFPRACSVTWVYAMGEVRFPEGDVIVHTSPQQFSTVLIAAPTYATPDELLRSLERCWPVEEDEEEDETELAEVWYEPANV